MAQVETRQSPISPMDISQTESQHTTRELTLYPEGSEVRQMGQVNAVDVTNHNPVSPVFATEDGKMHYANPSPDGFGPYPFWIIFKDGSTLFYGHCRQILVPDGSDVKAGEQIAIMGSEGNSTGPHVHLAWNPKGTPDSFLQNGVGRTFGATTAYLQKMKMSNIPTGYSPINNPALTGSDKNPGISIPVNTQPHNVSNILPAFIAYCVDNKVEKDDWDRVYVTHDGYDAVVTAEGTIKRKGTLNRIFMLNFCYNVVAGQEMDVKVDVGQAVHVSYSCNLSKFEESSILNDSLARAIMHDMTEVSNDMIDGHTGAEYTTKEYNKAIDGTGTGDNAHAELGKRFGHTETTGTASVQGLDGVGHEMLVWMSDHFDHAHNKASLFAGILGNAKWESRLDPNADNGSGAKGLFQWTRDRLQGLLDSAGASDIQHVSVQQQMAFMYKELSGRWGDGGGFDSIKDDPSSMTKWFYDIFEIPGADDPTLKNRQQFAEEFFAGMKHTAPTPAVPGNLTDVRFSKR